MCTVLGCQVTALAGGEAMRRRSLHLITTYVAATLLVALDTAPVRAQNAIRCTTRDSVVALVQGKRLGLSAAETRRLPYGRDLTLLIQTPSNVTRVVVDYTIEGGRDGPRVGRVAAMPEADSTCWAAPVPRLHINDEGSFVVDRLARPAYRGHLGSENFVGELLLEMISLEFPIPAGDVPARAREAALAAIQTSFETPPDQLVVEAAGGARPTPLADRLAVVMAGRIELVGVIDEVSGWGMEAGDVLDALANAGATATDPTCAFAPTLDSLRNQALALARATEAAIASRIAAGSLPWPRCALDLVESIQGITKEQSAFQQQAVEATRQLVEHESLREVGRLASQARSLTRITVSTKTISVPIGAEALERYTQVDLVTAYMPLVSMVQTFATATIYFSGIEDTHDFAASIRPATAGDRFGIQLGYAVGNPISDPDITFDPDFLVGVIGRLNTTLSISAGFVFASSDPGASCDPFEGDAPTTCQFFVSFNFDISSLGPFQKLFARGDR